jgi:hypothetical protein
MATGAKCYLIDQTSDGKWNLLEIPLGHDLNMGSQRVVIGSKCRELWLVVVRSEAPIGHS